MLGRIVRRYQASQGTVIRPVGWDAANDEPDRWRRSGHLYRCMTETEYKPHRSAGYIQSTGRYSVPGEGTNFSDDPGDAESYVNYGRDDPRKTGRPNYLVEVRNDPKVFKKWPDGYFKAADPVPLHLVTRTWRMVGEGGAVVAYLV
jgi:hypothetical protein